MSRLAYSLTDENRRRLRLLSAFGTSEGRDVTASDVVNRCVQSYFAKVLEEYRRNADPDDALLKLMEEIASDDPHDDCKAECSSEEIGMPSGKSPDGIRLFQVWISFISCTME